MTKVFAVGDIHGRSDELYRLIERAVDAGVDPDRDTLVFLGDYIDRGLQSALVMHTIQRWQGEYPHWVFLMGNHDEFMAFSPRNNPNLPELSVLRGDDTTWMANGGLMTIQSYVDRYGGIAWQEVMQLDAEWLSRLPYFHVIGSYIFTHAGVRPYVPIERQRKSDLAWIRREFLTVPFPLGTECTVVHGHTPTRNPYKWSGAINVCTTNGDYGSISGVILDPDTRADPIFLSEPLPRAWSPNANLWVPRGMENDERD